MTRKEPEIRMEEFYLLLGEKKVNWVAYRELIGMHEGHLIEHGFTVLGNKLTREDDETPRSYYHHTSGGVLEIYDSSIQHGIIIHGSKEMRSATQASLISLLDKIPHLGPGYSLNPIGEI